MCEREREREKERERESDGEVVDSQEVKQQWSQTTKLEGRRVDVETTDVKTLTPRIENVKALLLLRK